LTAEDKLAVSLHIWLHYSKWQLQITIKILLSLNSTDQLSTLKRRNNIVNLYYLLTSFWIW